MVASGTATAERSAYLAGPLGFSEAGRKFQYDYLIPCLLANGIKVVDPWKLTSASEFDAVSSLPPGSEQLARWIALDKKIGKRNEVAIASSDIVIAILDGTDVDSGTAAEIGFAAAINKRVFGYRGDFRLASDNQGATVNLQVQYFIERNGGHVYTSIPILLSALTSTRIEQVQCGKQSATNGADEPRSVIDPAEAASTDQIKDLLDFIKKTIAILFALSLGETFKQFVADKDDPNKRVIHWNRFPALAGLVTLMLPFYQGIYRYIFTTYQTPATVNFDYRWNLLFDTIMFISESALFFTMSRALDPVQWPRFTRCIMLLMAIDGIWAIQAHLFHAAPIASWAILDLLSLQTIVLLRHFYFKRISRGMPDIMQLKIFGKTASFSFWPWLVCLLSALRTTADYWSDWRHYFP